MYRKRVLTKTWSDKAMVMRRGRALRAQIAGMLGFNLAVRYLLLPRPLQGLELVPGQNQVLLRGLSLANRKNCRPERKGRILRLERTSLFAQEDSSHQKRATLRPLPWRRSL